MIVRIADFADHVAAHAGISMDRAEQAVVAVLKGIGTYLTPPVRELVAEELPAPLGDAVRDPDTPATTIEERVLAPGETAGEGREIVASVCRVLDEELSTDALAAIREALPPGYESFFAGSEPGERPPPPRGERDDTLATGRPGSRRPIAEARLDRTQTSSVAAGNPHDATKLSSTTGTTQERRHETLAEGQPEDPDRTLAGSHR